MFKKLIPLCALGALSACGGGGGGAQVGNGVIGEQIFPVTTPADIKTVSVFGLDRSAGTIFTESTDIFPADTIQSGRLAGTITFATTSGGRNFITKGDGSTIELKTAGVNGSGYTFVAADNSLLAIAGEVSPSVPNSGVVAYSGGADVVVIDGTDVTTLTTMNATANFSTDRVTIDLGGAGSKTLTIEDAIISGSNIGGGTLSAGSGFSGAPAGTVTLSNSGSFFGPNGTEMGGVFIFDETGANPFFAAGVYSSN